MTQFQTRQNIRLSIHAIYLTRCTIYAPSVIVSGVGLAIRETPENGRYSPILERLFTRYFTA